MSNLDIYNKVRDVPKEAKKAIKGGRMSGKTDINPMWRIKKLTEQFGPVGIGWYYEILEQRLEPVADGQVAAFVKIHLYYKHDGEWSMPIPGTGGNMFIVKETKGMHVSDECFKMALTDAISVSCKAIGVGADVYWDADKTKYDKEESAISELSEKQIARLYAIASKAGFTQDQVKKVIKKDYGLSSTKQLSKKQYDEICNRLEKSKESV